MLSAGRNVLLVLRLYRAATRPPTHAGRLERISVECELDRSPSRLRPSFVLPPLGSSTVGTASTWPALIATPARARSGDAHARRSGRAGRHRGKQRRSPKVRALPQRIGVADNSNRR